MFAVLEHRLIQKYSLLLFFPTPPRAEPTWINSSGLRDFDAIVPSVNDGMFYRARVCLFVWPLAGKLFMNFG